MEPRRLWPLVAAMGDQWSRREIVRMRSRQVSAESMDSQHFTFPAAYWGVYHGHIRGHSRETHRLDTRLHLLKSASNQEFGSG
jgi:hypothetical protein